MLLVCPIPYYDKLIVINPINADNTSEKVQVYYLTSDFILAFMFIRVYFLVRAVINYSDFTDIYAKKLCINYGFTANVRYTFKCLLLTRPGMTINSISLVSVFILAYLMRIFELPYYLALDRVDFNEYFTSIWLIVITMTTVGYGDISPYTSFGRFVAIFTAVWGTFLISLLVVSVGQMFALTFNEARALHHLLQTRQAARSITSAMRYYMAKKKYEQHQALTKAIRKKGLDSPLAAHDSMILRLSLEEEDYMIVDQVEED